LSAVVTPIDIGAIVGSANVIERVDATRSAPVVGAVEGAGGNRLWDGDSATSHACIRVAVEQFLDFEDVRPGEGFPRHLGETHIQVRQDSPPSLE